MSFTVYNIQKCSKFRKRPVKMEDRLKSDETHLVITMDSIAATDNLVSKTHQITTCAIAETLSVSMKTVHTIIN